MIHYISKILGRSNGKYVDHPVSLMSKVSTFTQIYID